MHISGLTTPIPIPPKLIDPSTEPSPSSSIGPALGSSVESSPGAAGTSFSDALSSAISQVESSRASANKSVEQFLSGDGDDLHSTILATQRADLEFQMFMQVRNKVVSAYQEVMKMQL